MQLVYTNSWLAAGCGGCYTISIAQCCSAVKRFWEKNFFKIFVKFCLTNFCLCATLLNSLRTIPSRTCAERCFLLGGPGPSNSVSTLQNFLTPQHTVFVLLRRKPGGYFWEKNFFHKTKRFVLATPPTQTFSPSIYRDFPNKKGLTAFFPIP